MKTVSLSGIAERAKRRNRRGKCNGLQLMNFNIMRDFD